MKKIGIIGMGYVGQAFYNLVKDHYETVTYDPKTHTDFPADELTECSLVAVCVPTPCAQDGSCDTSIVESMIRKIPNDFILIKSTVSPGTTEKIVTETGKHIVFSPEYISESTYQNPYYGTMLDMPYVVIGGDQVARTRTIQALEPIYGPMVQFYQCSSTEAEFIKYMANSYSALKVTFVNEMYDIVGALGANWHSVREGWLLDRRVERMSTSVFPDKRGYSGKCLPKDTIALIKTAHEKGITPHLLQGMNTANAAYASKRLAEHIPTDAIQNIQQKLYISTSHQDHAFVQFPRKNRYLQPEYVKNSIARQEFNLSTYSLEYIAS